MSLFRPIGNFVSLDFVSILYLQKECIFVIGTQAKSNAIALGISVSRVLGTKDLVKENLGNIEEAHFQRSPHSLGRISAKKTPCNSRIINACTKSMYLKEL